MAKMLVLAALALIGSAATVQGRELLQSASNLQPPAAVDTLFAWHAVGTQNYSAAADSSFTLVGATSDLYAGNTSQAVGYSEFNSQGQPEFFSYDDTGILGSVVGIPSQSAPVAAKGGDGGYGSVDELLLTATAGTGNLATVSYIQRLNTLGGVVPTGLYTLPAFGSVPNALLTIPYQADYIFLVPAGSAPAPAVSFAAAPVATVAG